MTQAPVKIGNVVGLLLGSGGQGCVLALDGRLCCATLPDMGGHKLGIHARGVDHGQADDQHDKDEPSAAPSSVGRSTGT